MSSINDDKLTYWLWAALFLVSNIKLFYGYHYPLSVYQDTYSKGGFTQLSLDLSSNCNYNCDWCFNKHLLNKREADILSFDEKKELLVEAKKLGAKTIVFPGTGEPTLDPDFYQLVKVANALRLVTVVYSNLTGDIDDEKIQYLFENNVSIGIKLDSFKLGYFTRRYHAKKETFDTFINNLNQVIHVYRMSKKKEEKNKAHRLIANMVLTLENKDELKNISSYCKKNNLPLFVRPVKPVYWANNSPVKWKLIGNEEGTQLPAIKLMQLANKYNTLFSPSSTLENHCAIYSFGLTVKNNGDVQICPDHHDSRGKFGNIRKNSLTEIMGKLTKNRIIKSGFCIMLPETL